MFHLGLWLSFFFNMQGSFHFLFQFDQGRDLLSQWTLH